MTKVQVTESELIYYIENAVKKYTEVKPVIKEQEGKGTGVRLGGATSSSSSGAYISAGAWGEGGILTKSGREGDIGSLPPEIDYTAAKGCPCEAWQIAEFGLSSGYITDPRCCTKGGGGTFSYETPLTTSVPCCEPCPEKKGWWRRCRESENDNSPCIYPTISDCELVKKEQTIKIKESDIIKIVKKMIKEQKLENTTKFSNDLWAKIRAGMKSWLGKKFGVEEGKSFWEIWENIPEHEQEAFLKKSGLTRKQVVMLIADMKASNS